MIEHVTIVKGKIKSCVNNLLNIIPHPVPQFLKKMIEIDLDPWEIRWGFDKIKVTFTETLYHDVDWYITSHNLNQSFAFSIILKKKPEIKNIFANAEACWLYNSINSKAERFLKKAFGSEKLDFRSQTNTISLLS